MTHCSYTSDGVLFQDICLIEALPLFDQLQMFKDCSYR